MTDQEATNVALLREAFSRLNSHDVDGCLAMLSPDFVINIAEMPYPKRGKRAWEQHAHTLLRALPDVTVTVDDMFGSRDKVSARLTIQGTHLGEFIGLAPTGRRVDYKSHEVYRFRDGLIAEEWICSDTATLLTQTGALARGRLLATWLAQYRTWFGFTGGLAAGAFAERRRQRRHR